MREKILKLVESNRFQLAITWLIVVNAILLGLETIPAVRAVSPVDLKQIDFFIVRVFVVEILLRFFAQDWRMGRDPWNLFDVWVVAISLMAINSGVSAFRALRVPRILRLISAFPRMRSVVVALLDSIPGIASVGFLLLLIVYVAAVLATNMFGESFPEQCGDLFSTMFTLFQILTLEGWVDIAQEVIAVYPSD